jgi:hypothetical protein
MREKQQYITNPPDVPMYLYKTKPQALRDLISWAKQEWIDRVNYCAEHGYMLQHARLTKDYTPIRILAEITGYRRICSLITQESWSKLSGRERVFLRRAFELRDLLLR